MPYRAQTLVFAAVFTFLGAVAGPLTQAAAQGRQAPMPMPFDMKGTPEEQAACAPDSARFCKRFEPDALQVLGCLQQNRGKLTASCQRVLANRGV